MPTMWSNADGLTRGRRILDRIEGRMPTMWSNADGLTRRRRILDRIGGVDLVLSMRFNRRLVVAPSGTFHNLHSTRRVRGLSRW
jgi:hypothetical protein